MKQAIAAIVFAAAFVSATHGQEIDLETAVGLALQSNLGIESEIASIRQKKLIADTWWNRFYPQASASLTMGRSNLESTASGISPLSSSFDSSTGGFDQVAAFSQEVPRWFMAAGLDLSLVLTLQTIPGLSLARLDYENGLISLDQARARVERDVSKQFYEILLLRERINLQDEQIANAERRYDQARINFDNGLIDEYTLLSSQVSLENLRPALINLQVFYQQALLGLRNSLGLPLTEEIVPVGTIDPPDIVVVEPSVGRNQLMQRFDVQQLNMAERLLRQQRRAADFNPQGGRSPYFRFGLNFDPTFQGDPLADDISNLDDWSQSSGRFTVTFVQPIDSWIPFSVTRNQLSDFDMQLERNRLQTEQALRGAEIAARGLLLEIQTSQRTIAALEQNVALAARAFELAEIGYNNGLRDLLEVETAELDLRNAELNLLAEQKNVMDSVLDLQFEVNASLDQISAVQEAGE